MAVAYGDRTLLPPPPRRRQPRAFAYGAPASRLRTVPGRIASIFELLRVERVDEHPPLSLTLSKLGLWIAVATMLTTGGIVGIVALLVRIFGAPFD
jgi:hypothetical protein